jgi:hypothetical protein
MFTNPATSHISRSLVGVILSSAPAHAEEHLVHAWDALSSALDESSKLDGGDRSKVTGNIDYARRHLECAVGAVPCVRDFLKRGAIRTECIELAKAIDDAARYF